MTISPVLTAAQTGELDTLAEIIRFHGPLIAFTGAGISTESGIPDYRGPQGLWTTGTAKPVEFQEFMTRPDIRMQWWQALPARFEQTQLRRPNAGHHALVRLEAAGVLWATITQNIDGLHLEAGGSPERVIELHGNSRTIRCTQCGRVYPIAQFLELAPALDEPPDCPNCGGILKPGTVSFGELMPKAEMQVAFTLALQAGVMLVVGSTLLVQPAARVPAYAKETGSYLAILNHGETGLDDIADQVIDAPAGSALLYLVEQLLR
jgi:NAD-dependent deacetylase